MIIVCSQCKASYLVPASTFASGPRQVRCARCGHVWLADLPPKTTAIPWDEPAGPQPIEKKDVEPPKQGTATPPDDPVQAQLPAIAEKTRGSPLAKVIVALTALLLLAGLAFLSFKAPKLSLLKGSSSKTSTELSLLNVTSERRFENGAMQLVVDGKIMNDTAKSQIIPPIEAAAIGPDGKNIRSWSIEPPAGSLDPQASLPFHSVITTPEGSIAAVNLKFGAVPLATPTAEPEAQPH